MIKEGIGKLSKPELASPVVFKHKKNSFLQFFVDYLGHITVKIRHSYLIHRMDEWIDAFWNAHIF